MLFQEEICDDYIKAASACVVYIKLEYIKEAVQDLERRYTTVRFSDVVTYFLHLQTCLPIPKISITQPRR